MNNKTSRIIEMKEVFFSQGTWVKQSLKLDRRLVRRVDSVVGTGGSSNSDKPTARNSTRRP